MGKIEKKGTMWSSKTKCDVEGNGRVKLRMRMGQHAAVRERRNANQVRWACGSERLFK